MSWEHLQDQLEVLKWTIPMFFLCGVLACTVAGFTGNLLLLFPGGFMGAMALWALNLRQLVKALAAKQATIDMLKLHGKPFKPSANVSYNEGDVLKLPDGCGRIYFHNETRVSIELA